MTNERNPYLEESAEKASTKFSHRLRQYPSDEFRLHGDDDGFISVGGFGEVSKYKHKKLEIVAIKKFRITGGTKSIKNSWNMVTREANVLCRFHHPNIVEMLGITKWSNAVGIVMEYVGGGNLRELLSEENLSDIAWDTRLHVAKGVVSALFYIHSHGEAKIFCHGDIKSENILLTYDGQVKLADFGSAAFIKFSGASTTTLEFSPTKQFTLHYVAPEVLQDPMPDKNPAMDVYSFGMVLYEIISRRVPYSDCEQPNFLPGLIQAKIKPTDKLVNEAEQQLKSDKDRSTFNLLKKLMLRCWNDDPLSRPDSETVNEEIKNFWNTSERTIEDNFPKKEKTLEEPKPDIIPRSGFLKRKSASTLLWLLIFFCVFNFDYTQFHNKALRNDMFKITDHFTSLSYCPAVSNLLERYKNASKDQDFQDARALISEIRRSIVNHVDASGTDAFRYGVKLQEQKRHLESVAIFDATAALIAKIEDRKEKLTMMKSCVEKMANANRAMIADDDDMKLTVKEHVIPLMHDWLQQMNNMPQVAKNRRCLQVSWVRASIADSQYLVGETKKREKTLTAAINEMKKVFGNDVNKQHGRLYGHFLYELSYECARSPQRREEATDHLQGAIDAFTAAEDYSSNEEENRIADIAKCEQFREAINYKIVP